MVSKTRMITFYHNSSFVERFEVVVEVFELFPMLWLEEVFFCKRLCFLTRFILAAERDNLVFAV